MEHYKNLTSLSGNMLSSQPMSKMIAQVLVGVSVVSSLLLSLLSLCSSPPLITYSENLNYFSWRYSFQMILGRAMSKNSVFLICNGLLVFVAKTSGIVRSPSGAFDPNDMLQAEIVDGLEMAVVTEPEPQVAVEISELSEDIAVLEEKSECKEEYVEDDDDDDRSIEVKEVINEITSISTEEISDEEEKHECCLLDEEQHRGGQAEDDNGEDEEVHGEEAKEDEEEEYVDEMEKMSTEELNKKFEDFIRRMKEEFRISNINESTRRQQLVMVN